VPVHDDDAAIKERARAALVRAGRPPYADVVARMNSARPDDPVSRTQVDRWLAPPPGGVAIPARYIAPLATALGTTVSDLLGVKDPLPDTIRARDAVLDELQKQVAAHARTQETLVAFFAGEILTAEQRQELSAALRDSIAETGRFSASDEEPGSPDSAQPASRAAADR
jgi:hypothetical protein